ncbi:MAG: glycosyltransferase family 2 protein [candidate division Zixibacteria bacterium]|jgi:dolichol-phosphate mannosyltransferase|nr:glycosyltransferase family 2 protein [candidate division Zixibacteria bacterium]
MSTTHRILCILPAYNESGKIGKVVRKVKATGQVDEIVVVDDCSTDTTGEEAREAGATVVRHETNQGVGAGIRSGLIYGRAHGFTIAVIMSGDDQHEPEELQSVLDILREDRADFVQGSRRIPGGRTVNAPVFREISTRLFSLAFTLLSGRRITDGTNGFRAFFLRILDNPRIRLDQPWLNTYELEPYLLFRAVQDKNCRVVEAPVTVYYHTESRQYTKMKPFRDWWRLARPLFLLRLGLRE